MNVHGAMRDLLSIIVLWREICHSLIVNSLGNLAGSLVKPQLCTEIIVLSLVLSVNINKFQEAIKALIEVDVMYF